MNKKSVSTHSSSLSSLGDIVFKSSLNKHDDDINYITRKMLRMTLLPNL